MNTLKFYARNDLAPELYNLEHSFESAIQLFGKEYTVWEPLNLHILIDATVPEEEYRANLCQVLDTVQAEISVNHVTSETLSRLLWVVRECRRREFIFRTFTIPLEMLTASVEGKPLYRQLAEEGCINCIDVTSKCAGEQGTESIDRVAEKLSWYMKLHGGTLRFSFSVSDRIQPAMAAVKRTVDYYQEHGITDLIFRDIVDFPQEYQYQYIRTLQNPFYQVKVYRYHDLIAKYYEARQDAQYKTCSMVYCDGSLFCGRKKVKYG